MSVPQKSARLTRLPRVRTAAAAAAVGAGLLVGLTACGSGQVSQTTNQQPAVPGAQGMTGQLALRNVELTYPSNDGATQQFDNGKPLDMTFIISNNSPDTADKLVSIEPTNGQGSVKIDGNTSLPAQQALRAGTPSLLLVDSAAVSESPASGATNRHIDVVYTGGAATLTPGLNVDMKFTFSNAPAITLPVPIVAPIDQPRQP